MNGREAVEAEPVLDALPDLEQYIFCSSAGGWVCGLGSGRGGRGG